MSLMRRLLLLALLAAALVAGCKRHEEPAAAPGLGQAEAPPSPRGPGPMPVAAAPAVITDSGDVNVTLQQLSDELRKYIIRSRSVPKDFEEFAAKCNAQFPSAPAGKRYVIKDQAVVLAKK